MCSRDCVRWCTLKFRCSVLMSVVWSGKRKRACHTLNVPADQSEERVLNAQWILDTVSNAGGLCALQCGGGFLSMCSLLVFFMTNLQRAALSVVSVSHSATLADGSLHAESNNQKMNCWIYRIKLLWASAAFSRIILLSGWPVPPSWSEAQSRQQSHPAALNCKDTPTKQMWKWRKAQTGSWIWRWKSECWCWTLSVRMLHRLEVSGKRKGNSGKVG